VKRLGKMTLKSVGDDKLKNREMRQIFGGTYGGGYGVDGEVKCDPKANPCSGACKTNNARGELTEGTCQTSSLVYNLCGCVIK
jgi:natural product precursor